MGAEPNGAPIDMVGTAVREVRKDGVLQHNWVERNAREVYGSILAPPQLRPIRIT